MFSLKSLPQSWWLESNSKHGDFIFISGFHVVFKLSYHPIKFMNHQNNNQFLCLSVFFFWQNLLIVFLIITQTTKFRHGRSQRWASKFHTRKSLPIDSVSLLILHMLDFPAPTQAETLIQHQIIAHPHLESLAESPGPQPMWTVWFLFYNRQYNE